MDIHKEASRIVKKKQAGKLQLNSGTLPQKVYDYYHDEVPAWTGQPIATEVAEALIHYMPISIEKHDINKCPHCHASIERHHIYCWSCAQKIRAT